MELTQGEIILKMVENVYIVIQIFFFFTNMNLLVSHVVTT